MHLVIKLQHQMQCKKKLPQLNNIKQEGEMKNNADQSKAGKASE
jgi:hypothetical protein